MQHQRQLRGVRYFCRPPWLLFSWVQLLQHSVLRGGLLQWIVARHSAICIFVCCDERGDGASWIGAGWNERLRLRQRCCQRVHGDVPSTQLCVLCCTPPPNVWERDLDGSADSPSYWHVLQHCWRERESDRPTEPDRRAGFSSRAVLLSADAGLRRCALLCDVQRQ